MPTMHRLYLIISKLSDIWGDTVQIEVSLVMRNYCVQTFCPEPNVTLYFQQNA